MVTWPSLNRGLWELSTVEKVRDLEWAMASCPPPSACWRLRATPRCSIVPAHLAAKLGSAASS